MGQKKHKLLLVIGILSVVIAMAGIFWLEPPGSEPEPQASETPEQYQPVLRPEDLMTPSAQPTAAAASHRTASVNPTVRPSATRRVSASASAGSSASQSASVRSSATRRASAQTTPRRTSAPVATAARQTPSLPVPESAPPVSESPDSTAAPPTPSASYEGESPASPAASATEESPGPPAESDSGSGSASPAASASSQPVVRSVRTAAKSAGATPYEDSTAPSPVVSHGGGLLPAADSRFTITTDGVEAAGGMKLIEGFQATGTAVLRDIRNTLLTSSSLVKGYKDGEEIGGFEPIGTGTVLELSTRAGEVVDTAVVLIPGDVTGTGVLDIAQVARLAAAVEGREPLSGVHFLAADVDGSGVLDEGDVMAMSYALNRRTARRAASGG